MGRSKSIVKKQPYIRKEIYSIDEVYNAVKDGLFEEKKTFVDMDGDMIKANSQRYQTFFTKGIKCCRCGIEGRYFAKEKNPERKKISFESVCSRSRWGRSDDDKRSYHPRFQRWQEYA